MILSRFPIIAHDRQIIRDSSGPRPIYRVATADPPARIARRRVLPMQPLRGLGGCGKSNARSLKPGTPTHL